MRRFALKSRRVLTESGLREAVVFVSGEKIESVTDRVDPAIFCEDFGDLVIMPGLVDSHVHVNEPGRTEWEGYTTATRAALLGGVTTIVDMPLNCIPVTTTRAALRTKLAACESQLWTDVGYWGGVVPGNAADLAELAEDGILGAKAFLVHSGIDDFPRCTEADLRSAMPVLREAGLPLLVHAELECETSEDKARSPREYGRYLSSRPRVFEDAAIALMIELCRKTRCAVHIVHLSSSSALSMLKDARAEGLPITVETCPHYLCLTAEEIPEGHTAYKCAPPIRESENRERLWEGLKDGVIDLVVSDHSPCTPHLKLPERGDFLEAWGGIASLQFGLAAVHTEARKRGFSVSELARWMSEKPAQLVGRGRQKGALKAGYSADLCVWNPEAELIVEAQKIEHRHKVTPYLGKKLSGAVEHTFLRGEQVVRDRKVIGEPCGQHLLRRSE